MENTLSTPLLPSHVSMDTLYLDTAQSFVRLQEFGITSPQHVEKVTKLHIFKISSNSF